MQRQDRCLSILNLLADLEIVPNDYGRASLSGNVDLTEYAVCFVWEGVLLREGGWAGVLSSCSQ